LPPHDKGAPAFRAPPQSADCHFHVFGPAGLYPYAADVTYQPPLAPLDEYLALARTLGIERYVFVQPSTYGRDNACMLDAMREVAARGGVPRGIVDIDENIPDAALVDLHAQGVRGVRINVSPVRPYEAGFSATLIPRIDRLHARCAEMGWQLDFLMPGWLTSELMPLLRRLEVDFTLAHMGMFLAKDGAQQPGFQELLDLLREGARRCWVKLTGVYRMSTAVGYADAAPMAQALIDAAPDRVIWGSDFPHLSFAGEVDPLEQFNLIGAWAPGDAMRRRILVENPQQLFNF